MASKKTNDKIVWLDMEMTGLDPNECHILEIACFVTDKDLKKISPTFHTVVHQPPNILTTMNAWCMEQHKKSGLIKDSESSKVTIEEAEELLLKFLVKYTYPGGCPLAGNTIYMDKVFLMKYLPKSANYLHYRLIDVSTINELCRRWYPNFKGMRKVLSHRAINDIEESCSELKYLRKNYFIKNISSQHSSRVDDDFDNILFGT